MATRICWEIREDPLGSSGESERFLYPPCPKSYDPPGATGGSRERRVKSDRIRWGIRADPSGSIGESERFLYPPWPKSYDPPGAARGSRERHVQSERIRWGIRADPLGSIGDSEQIDRLLQNFCVLKGSKSAGRTLGTPLRSGGPKPASDQNVVFWPGKCKKDWVNIEIWGSRGLPLKGRKRYWRLVGYSCFASLLFPPGASEARRRRRRGRKEGRKERKGRKD